MRSRDSDLAYDEKTARVTATVPIHPALNESAGVLYVDAENARIVARPPNIFPRASHASLTPCHVVLWRNAESASRSYVASIAVRIDDFIFGERLLGHKLVVVAILYDNNNNNFIK